MELQRAIEIQTIHNDHNPNITDAERNQAHQLGIEAMKWTQQARKGMHGLYPGPFPGETQEVAHAT